MALATAVGAAQFDRTANTFQLDLSTQLSEVIRPDNEAFLSRIGTAGFVATQRTHYWAEDELNPNTDTVAETLTADDTTCTVTTGTRFKVGTIFRFNELGKTEVLQVTAISTNDLTVTRGYGSTTGETHATGATIEIIAHPKQEGWKPTQEDWTQERSSAYNYTQIFGRGITLARTRQLVEQTVIASELAHQSAYRLKEIARELDDTVINGIRSVAPSDAAYGTMGGLWEYVTASSGNSTTTTEDLTEAVVNALYKDVWDDAGGVEQGFILVGGALKRVISTFDQAYRRMDFDSRAAGFVIERFLTDLGAELTVIVDPKIMNDLMIIGDLGKVKLGPLSGDAMQLEELAKTGRTLEYMVSGQYTLEVRNALKCFGAHNNLS